MVVMSQDVVASLKRFEKKAAIKKYARSLAGLASLVGRRKVAYMLNESKIDQAIRKQLKRDGLEDIPDFDFGDLFYGAVNRARERYWTDSDFEEVVSNVVEDLIAWETIDRGEGIRKYGSLANYIRHLREQGKSDDEISRMLFKRVMNMAQNTHRHEVQRVRRNPADKSEPADRYDDSYEEEEDEKGGPGPETGDRMQMDQGPSIAQNWMDTNLLDPEEIYDEALERGDFNENFKEMIDRLERELSITKNPKAHLIWEAYKQYPWPEKFEINDPDETGTLKKRLDEIIEYDHPEEGAVQEPLGEALQRFGLDPTGSTSLYYYAEKVAKNMDDIWRDLTGQPLFEDWSPTYY